MFKPRIRITTLDNKTFSVEIFKWIPYPRWEKFYLDDFVFFSAEDAEETIYNYFNPRKPIVVKYIKV